MRLLITFFLNAQLLWNITKCTFNLQNIPDNVHDMFNVWLKSCNKQEKDLVAVAISTIFWTIWKLRNVVIFVNNKVSDPCGHVNWITRMLHDWLILQIKPGRWELMMDGVKKVELIVGGVFRATLRWRMTHRIAAGWWRKGGALHQGKSLLSCTCCWLAIYFPRCYFC